MSEIVSLKLADREPQTSPEVIDALEKLLAAAKAGEITSLAYATVSRDGSLQTWWAGGKEMNFALCAGIVRLSWRYQDEAFNERHGDHGQA